MEFASRRGGPGARTLAGLVVLVVLSLGGPACRRATRSEAGRAAAPAGPATASLGGRVVDESARAIPGARVLALGPEGDARASESTPAVTDADGRFRIE